MTPPTGRCTAPGLLPRGERIYAIGDVHGCADRLRALHARIVDHLGARPAARATLVHLGDYVDRGPDSAGVVRLLRNGSPVPGTRSVCLMGNHERTMLDALGGDRAAGTDWLFNGGRQALASWGADPETGLRGWRQAIPALDHAWLHGLGRWHRAGGYLFVHAGIRPGVALESQTEDDLLHIRQSFMSSDADFGAVVVHGHSVKPDPVIRPNRIGIDTGAVFGGPLTCVALEDDTMEFIQIEGTR